MTLYAGAARLALEPPLGLPMIGFVRQRLPATGYGAWPLETSAIALDADGRRVILCGVDVIGVGEPEVSDLIDRVVDATGADPAGVVLNWSHTHLAPPGSGWAGELLGEPDARREARVRSFADVLQDKVVSVCRLAFERLEPARVVWGLGEADLAVNRRERVGGRTILGWNPDNLVDNHVGVLQARRPDDSAIATVVAYGCHPVTTGFDMSVYSADYPGPLRELVRRITGGECVFLQAAGGNVLPRVAFTDDEREAERMGRRLALEALHAVADRPSAPVRIVRQDDGSVTPISAYRRQEEAAEAPLLAATRRRVTFPLLPLPSLDEVAAQRQAADAELEAARASGDAGRIKVAWYHAGWARKVERALRDGTAPRATEGWVNAVRIGDGLIATGPGEIFTEIGMAVKERRRAFRRSTSATRTASSRTSRPLPSTPTAATRPTTPAAATACPRRSPPSASRSSSRQPSGRARSSSPTRSPGTPRRDGTRPGSSRSSRRHRPSSTRRAPRGSPREQGSARPLTTILRTAGPDRERRAVRPGRGPGPR